MLRHLKHAIAIDAPLEVIWPLVTHVDVASFPLPRILEWLGVPKPMRSEILCAEEGGERLAHFSNGRRIRQRITEWKPHQTYAFTFHPDPGFRVAYILDLGNGPFRLCESRYHLEQKGALVRLTLTGSYELRGILGICIFPPVKVILHFMQRFMLRSINMNAELVNQFQ